MRCFQGPIWGAECMSQFYAPAITPETRQPYPLLSRVSSFVLAHKLANILDMLELLLGYILRLLALEHALQPPSPRTLRHKKQLES